MNWRHPGRTGAGLYALAAAVVGTLIGLFSRLQVARQGGRRALARQLPAGPVIVISNHASYADGVLLVLACRRMGRSLRMLATSGVFKAPLLGALVRRLGFIPVKRGTAEAADSLAPAVEALRAGEAIGVFPEGRLTRNDGFWPERAKTGAVRLALASGAPIVPVAMDGSQRVIGRKRLLLGLVANLIRRPQVHVRVGEPIDVRRLMNIGSATQPTSEEIRLATDQVMARLVTLVGALRGTPSPHPEGAPRSAD